MLHNQKLVFLKSFIQLKNIEVDTKKLHVFSLQTAVDEMSDTIRGMHLSISEAETELRTSMMSLRPIDLATRHLKFLAIEKNKEELSNKKEKYRQASEELESCLHELQKVSSFSDSLKDFEHDLKREVISSHNKSIEKEVEELFLIRKGAVYD